MAEGVAWDAYTLIEAGANATWQIAADAADAAYNNDMDIAEDDWNLAHSEATADYDLAALIAEADWYIAEAGAWSTFEGAMNSAQSDWNDAESDAWDDYDTATSGSTDTGTGSRYILTGTSSGNKKGTPLVAFNEIGNGFPKTLPAPGTVSVIVAQRNAHTFVLLLNSNGQITFFRGGPDDDDNLAVEMGPYGTGSEEYFPDKTKFRWLGDSNDVVVNRLKELMNSINAEEREYQPLTENCNGVTIDGIRTTGQSVPNTPVEGTQNAPGWSERISTTGG